MIDPENGLAKKGSKFPLCPKLEAFVASSSSQRTSYKTPQVK
jgi:hypothetical protein